MAGNKVKVVFREVYSGTTSSITESDFFTPLAGYVYRLTVTASVVVTPEVGGAGATISVDVSDSVFGTIASAFANGATDGTNTSTAGETTAIAGNGQTWTLTATASNPIGQLVSFTVTVLIEQVIKP